MPVNLLLLILDNISISASCRGMKKLALLTSHILTKISFRGLTQNLAKPAAIPIITMSDRRIIFFSIGVLLLFEFFMFLSQIAMKVVRVAFSH